MRLVTAAQMTAIDRRSIDEHSISGYTLMQRAGQAVVAESGEWVRYSTPGAGGAVYIAVCLPAFAPETLHRDAG